MGVPYRLHGRNPAFGLDCVGLVAHSLSESGGILPVIPPYGLRNSRYGFVTNLAQNAGFEAVTDDFRCGDFLCAIPGPAQLHLLIVLGPKLLVHADAGRRQVVRIMAPLPWPVMHHFRFIERG